MMIFDSDPLRQSTIDTLNRQLKSGISDEDLAGLVIEMREDDRLCIVHGEQERREPRIICSLGRIRLDAPFFTRSVVQTLGPTTIL